MGDEGGDLFEFVVAVVDGGDEQGGDFEPDFGVMGEVAEGLEDGLEGGAAESVVEILVEGFEVDVDGVEPGAGEVDGLGGEVAVADEDVGEALGAGADGTVGGEFHEDGGFGVGVGDAGALVVEGGLDEGGGVVGLAADLFLEAG